MLPPHRTTFACWNAFKGNCIPTFRKHLHWRSVCYSSNSKRLLLYRFGWNASMNWEPRLATESDIPALEAFIPLSARELQADYYTPNQIEAAIGPVFGVDRQLIQDRTYFVMEQGGEIIGCGGWSRRPTMFGGDRHR